jgi:putative membrane protein
MNAMVADHNADVAAFRAYSKSGADTDLRTWAGKTLPTLEEHQKMAKETAAKLGGSAKK